MQIESRLTRVGRFRPLLLVLAVTAAVPALGLVLAVPKTTTHAAVHRAQAPSAAQSTPTAAEFARAFVAMTGVYAAEHGQRMQFTRVDCVEAAPGRYMCSYALARPHRPSECHIMQATWTPDQASKILVTLAGRTRRCGTLHQAVASLR